jgi:hypothetical protein
MAKRGRKPKERKGYFYEKEEQAVIDYIASPNPEEKNRIFNSILLPAFTKMIESIIRRYKLFVPEEEFQQTFNDTISYLLTKIGNYKREVWGYDEIFEEPPEPPVDLTAAGFIELRKTVNEHSPKYVRVFKNPYNPPEYQWATDKIKKEIWEEEPLYRLYKLELHHYKAYSYCGTVCKNYLTYKNIQYTKNKQRNLPYDEMLDDFSRDPKYMTKEEDTEQNTVERLIAGVSKEIKAMMSDRETNGLTDDEMKVGTALTELLDNWEEVLNLDGSNKLQKSSVLYFLREETMMTTKQVRDNMKSFKKAYYILKKGLIENE